MKKINEYIFIYISLFMDTCTIYLSQDFSLLLNFVMGQSIRKGG
jgi:hypothetical protein